MIDQAVKFILDRLNAVIVRDRKNKPAEDIFSYVGTNADESISFKRDSVSIMLVRIEEETTLRKPDVYSRVSDKGVHQKVSPEIRMNLWLLFVSRFPNDYSSALLYLSRLISYFQNHRVFNQEDWPELKPNIPRLVLELVTPSFSEQNEIWGSLRAAYQPSAVYKMQMIVFEDNEAVDLPPITEITQNTIQELS